MNLERQSKMYPKVKVRAQEVDDDSHSLSAAKAVKSQPVNHLCSTGSKNKHASLGLTSAIGRKNCYPSPSAATNKATTPNSNSSMSHQSPSTGRSKNEKNGNDGEVSKKCGRANSVLRPRAVLSSPVNDEMIGKMNKLNRRPLPKEKPDLERKSPAQARSIQSKVEPATASPLREKAGLSATIDVNIV